MLAFQTEHSLRQGLLDAQSHSDDHDVRLAIDPLVPPPLHTQIVAWIFDENGYRTLHATSRADLLLLIRRATGDNTRSLLSPETSPTRRPLCRETRYPPVHMRDIRQLDQAYTDATEPSLVFRDQAILVNVVPIRAIILRNQFVVLSANSQVDSDRMAQLQTRVQTYLRESPSTPFEFTALEGLLAIVSAWFAAQCTLLTPTVDVALTSFATNDRPREEFDQLRKVQSAATTMHLQLSGIRRMLMALLDDEHALGMMHLTNLSSPVDEVESILETNVQDMFGTLASISMVLTKIDHTQRMVDLTWTSKRNYLLVVDMSLKCMFLGLLVTHLWTGMFGQNLHSYVEGDDVWFTATFGSCAAWILGSYVVVYVYFKSKGIVLSWRMRGFDLPE